MKTKFLLSLLTVMFLVSGCSSSLFELKSVEQNYDYFEGREILKKESREAVIYVNFEEQRDGCFVVYIESVNKTDIPAILDPSSVRLEIEKTNSAEYYSGDKFFALDPENEIERIDKAQTDLETSHAVTQGLHGLFAVAEVVSDLADDNGGEALDDAVKWGTVIHNKNVEHEIKTDQLLEERLYWQHEVLRKTTLYKNDRYGGIIYVPFDKESEKVDIIVPFGNFEYKFLFEQREIK